MSKKPNGEIGEERSVIMQLLYSKYKAAALKSSERSFFEFKPSEFLTLLKNVIKYSSSGGSDFDGLRIYYGVLYDNHKVNGQTEEYKKLSNGGKNDDRLLLIFVPTDNGNQDNLNNIWATTGDLFVKCNKDSASDFVKQYLNFRAPLLTDDGNSFLYNNQKKKFIEAKCIWYDIETITYDDGTNCGLIEYINDGITHGTIDKVTIYLAAISQHEDPRYLYHLSLVFDIDDKIHLTLTNTSTKKSLLNTTADTGSPCPPPNSPCSGTLLPLK